ncbi:hypothetical protein VP01_386g8 [Puccinia sorghi]|uniref:Uncharacterized protein n=1 Tax=Puccinia sorghi TaxID=27349 RepID=A0A0L6UT32_9BASI|nr:hypothetical protein VP01_386g8 [Puccinia sorghi]
MDANGAVTSYCIPLYACCFTSRTSAQSNLTFYFSTKLAEMKLPHWDSIRRTCENIRQMLNIQIKQAHTIFNEKFYSLSLKDNLGHVSMFHCIELSNPYVNKHLHFIPHDPWGRNVYDLYQSAKWREHLPPDVCVGVVLVVNFFRLRHHGA